jgi:hypothetical protein
LQPFFILGSETALFAHHPQKKIIKKKQDRRPIKHRLSDINRKNVNLDKCITKVEGAPAEFTLLSADGGLYLLFYLLQFTCYNQLQFFVSQNMPRLEPTYFNSGKMETQRRNGSLSPMMSLPSPFLQTASLFPKAECRRDPLLFVLAAAKQNKNIYMSVVLKS